MTVELLYLSRPGIKQKEKRKICGDGRTERRKGLDDRRKRRRKKGEREKMNEEKKERKKKGWVSQRQARPFKGTLSSTDQVLPSTAYTIMNS